MFRKNKRGKHNDEEHEFVVILIKDRSVKNMMGTSNDLYFYRNKEARIRFNYPLGDATYVGFSSINELEEYGRVLIFINGELCYETKREDAIENKSNLNLLEIKLKDTDSVPEIYYKGQRMDEMPKSLVDITYHWHTEDEYQVPRGANDITIEYYDSPNNKYLDRKIIGHKRDM